MTESSNSSSSLLQCLQSPVNYVQILDESHGLFGEWYNPQQVLSSLWEEATVDANVGTPTAPGLIRSQDYAQTTFLNASYQPVTPHEMALELHNTTSDSIVRLRWMDHRGTNNPLTHQWDVAPSSTFEQFTKPGDLFLISLVTMEGRESQEYVLGAYRTKRALPSLTPHCILVQGGEEEDEGILLEMLLLDETKFDALVVAGADLDHHRETPNDRERIERTIELLQTIVRNVMKHPGEEKYRKLRLSNSKIKRQICDSWGALELLRIVGFVKKSLPSETPGSSEDEDYLVLPCPADKPTVCQCALDILGIVLSRVQPDFIGDIAPPTPWQEPVPLGAGNHNRGWNAQRGFITDEEKWARAERVAGQRRRGGRKPAPGEAPSSRGKWGR